jgi:branched-chain amino acid transport system permease protein
MISFTLFFGVLKYQVLAWRCADSRRLHGLATYIGCARSGLAHPLLLLAVLVVAILAMAALGMLIARYLVMPLRSAPALSHC